MRTNLVQRVVMVFSIPVILVMGVSFLSDMNSGSLYLRISKMILYISMIAVLLLVSVFAKAFANILNRGDEA